MTNYNEQLENLSRQMARAKHLESVLADIRVQRQTLWEKACDLEVAMHKEQADVERLEKRTLTAFFYDIVGKKMEKYEKEYSEAYEATIRYDSAMREVTAMDEALRSYEEEWQRVRGCEGQYQQLLQRKCVELKQSGTPEAEEILRLEEQIAQAKSQQKELREAISAGRKALQMTDAVLDKLGSAENWGTWDLLGGGFISDIAKHSALDEAQHLVEQLQVQLRCFKSELADVTIHADMQVSIQDFLRFADFFFDDVFADWAVLDRIHKAKQQVRDTKSRIESVVVRLEQMSGRSDEEQRQTKARIDDFVLKATL